MRRCGLQDAPPKRRFGTSRPWHLDPGEQTRLNKPSWPMASSDVFATTPSATLRTIQARNYRSLRHLDLRLDGSFHVLVGPNASGKSTLLDAISFITDFVQIGLVKAVRRRTSNFQDLVWGRPATSPSFELAAGFLFNEQEMR